MFHIYMYKYICMYMHECRSLAQFKRNKPKSKSPPQRSTALAEYLTLAPAAMEPRCLDARQKYVYPPEPYSRWKNIITTKNWIGRIRKLCDERNSAHMSRLVGSHPTISIYDGLVHPVFHPWTYMCS